MKQQLSLLASLLILPISLTYALDLGGLSDKLSTEESEAKSGFDVSAIRDQVTSVFDSASPEVKGAVQSALSSYVEKSDLKVFDYLKVVQGANLTPQQATLWNTVKTDMMAAILQRNFTFESLRNTNLFNSALDSLRSGDLEALKSTYSNLSSQVKLTDQQKTLFQNAIAYAAPLKSKTTEGLKSLFGG